MVEYVRLRQIESMTMNDAHCCLLIDRQHQAIYTDALAAASSAFNWIKYLSRPPPYSN